MNHKEFDKYVFARAAEEMPPVSDSLHEKTEETLSALPPQFPRRKKNAFRSVAAAAACMAILLFGVLPNASAAYAAAAEDIPVIGSIVRVLTLHNYFYQNETHELQADIPVVTDPDNSEAGEFINKDVAALTQAALDDFYARLAQENSSYDSLQIDYETLTNTDSWFTLKLMVSRVEADIDLTYRFYHIDRTTGKYVVLTDLFSAEALAVLEDHILQQMRAEAGKYWLEDEPGCTVLDAAQNFYFSENGSLVIVYDKFEVGPGSTGCPEFTFDAAVYKDLLNPDYVSVLFPA